MQHGTIDILKPLGLSEDACKYTLSPRSERAYSRINSEFDMLFQQLQPPDAKVDFAIPKLQITYSSCFGALSEA